MTNQDITPEQILELLDGEIDILALLDEQPKKD
jgi:hypothetical protein